MHTRQRKTRAGLSLVEVVVSTMLVSVVLIGALECVGGVIRGRMMTGDHCKAQQLADQLMAEIVEHAFQEPVDAPVFGRESSESGGVRTEWDDVDDYHQWTATPPEDRMGIALPNSTGWQREVQVEWVDPANPSAVVGIGLGLKRITVTVRRNGIALAQQVALRSDEYTGTTP